MKVDWRIWKKSSGRSAMGLKEEGKKTKGKERRTRHESAPPVGDWQVMEQGVVLWKEQAWVIPREEPTVWHWTEVGKRKEEEGGETRRRGRRKEFGER